MPSPVADTTSAGGDAHVSYGLAFQLVFYSRDGVVTLSDSIDANPAFGDCSAPAESIEAALREVCTLWFVRYRASLERNHRLMQCFFKNKNKCGV